MATTKFIILHGFIACVLLALLTFLYFGTGPVQSLEVSKAEIAEVQ